ncbi:hypothetical protein M406DRAFT_11035, partial [Cryphonectria parasitica EP155]
MLGKLFNLSAGGGTSAQVQAQASSYSYPGKQVSSLESVQEDIHTRCLLFPDAQALYQQHGNDQVFPMSSASALSTPTNNPFDLNGDIELEGRDVRVVIMQDTSSSSPASLLYDSQPLPVSQTSSPTTPAGDRPTTQQPPLPPQRRTSAGGQPSSSRPLSITQHPPGSPQQRQSAFDRRSSIHGRTQSRAETESQRAAREYKQEIDTFAGCIFGNNEFLAYKGTSTKVHVVPSDLRLSDGGSSFAADGGRGSLGRSAARASKLSQSFSSETMMPSFDQAGVSSPHAHSRPLDRKRVLITRLFPVNLPTDDNPMSSPRGHFSEDSSEFPFPPLHAGGDDGISSGRSKAKKPQLKQKRTPMYAVALIVSLPPGSPPSAVPPLSASRSTFRGSSSYTDQQDSFPSSYSSTRRSGWGGGGGAAAATPGGPMFGGFDAFDSGFSLDAEERIDTITRHWDIIMRTLTSLQSVAATQIFSLLRQADMSSPDPRPTITTTANNNNNHTAAVRASRASSNAAQKPPKTNTKFVSLLPNCLADDVQIRIEVDSARVRIVSGLKATRVVTGQNRWGIWREEARWVERWAGGRDQGFFFFNLLTGFLSVHTDWLQALSPSKYRRQFSMLQKLRGGDDDLSLPARTVIVGQDRVAARRLIFLLSAFLPANLQLPTSAVASAATSSSRTHQHPHQQRPSTSASWGTFSQSPPSFIVPLTKEESLRRKINRRGGGGSGTSRHASHSRNASSIYTTTSSKSSVPAQLAHLSIDSPRERRASDAMSIRTTNLPILAADLDNRKISAATIVPENSVAHFALSGRHGGGAGGSGSGGSTTATDDLKRSLQRGDSIGSSDTQSSSRWGSVISGLWGSTTRRRDSAMTTPPQSLNPREHGSNNNTSRAQQTRKTDGPRKQQDSVPETPRRSQDGGQNRQQQQQQQDNPEPSRVPPIPVERKVDPNSAFDSPVKTTINEEDGVIDVDVPFPDFIASFETAVSSPSSSGYLSTPGLSGLELFEQACRVTIDGDVPQNVAGWLQRYHPDFILQAIPPQADDLLEQIRASLKAEPTPLLSMTSTMTGGAATPFSDTPRGGERWVDVSSALIADSTNFTIRRIRYRRLVKFKTAAGGPSGGDKATPLLSSSVNTMSSAVLTPMVSPYEQHLQDEFIEDPIVALDDTLIEAVERVTAGSGDLSKESSQSSSRSPSKRRESIGDALVAMTSSATASRGPLHQEVPRGECKAVVLSALEHIAKDVVQRRD